MFDECTCDCHLPGHFAMHMAPCCETCPDCGKRIAMEMWGEHAAACGVQVQFSEPDSFEDAEGVIIAALEFYANAGEDNGELARKTMKIITAT